MAYDVEVSGYARLDMKNIYDYIANTLQEPVIAEKQYSRIEKAVYSLDNLPERFRRYDKEPWRSRNLRVMPVDNYLVFYVVDNDSQIVTVMRIMYGRRNIENELNNEF